MKELRTMAANFKLVPQEPPDGGPFLPMAELIVVTSEPRYMADEGGGTYRRRVMDEYRFGTSPDGMRQLAKLLTEWADELDAMAKTCRHEPKKAAKAAGPKSLPGTEQPPTEPPK